MTAEEFLKKKNYPSFNENGGLGVLYCKEAMIEFAKYHAEQALLRASEEAKIFLAEDWIRKKEIIHPGSLVSSVEIKVYTPSILKSYPLENIK